MVARCVGVARVGFPLDNLFLKPHLYWLYSRADFLLCAQS
jgi:hypothetical protein